MLFFRSLFFKAKIKKRNNRIIKKKNFSITCISTLFLSLFITTIAKEKTNQYEATLCKLYTQKALHEPGKKIKKIFFVPDSDVKILLLGLIHLSKPKSKIRIAVYQLTDKDIVDALILAHKRGVLIEIITDQSCLYNRYEKISSLRKLGIPVHVYGGKYYSIMHNKFFVFENTLNGKAIVFTGSANATLGGTTRNEENVWIVENKKIIEQYKQKFDTLKKKIAIMPRPKRQEQFSKKIYNNMIKRMNDVLELLWIFG